MQLSFDKAGISVQVVGSFYEDSDEVVGRIDDRSILEGTLEVGASADVDAVFVSLHQSACCLCHSKGREYFEQASDGQ